MNTSRWLLAACLGLAAGSAGAQHGLTLPAEDSRWQWRAQGLIGPGLPTGGLGTEARHTQGLRLIGDYVLYGLRAPDGGFSAMLRASGGLTLTERAVGREFGLATQPFLGLGVSGVWPRSGWSLSADLGFTGHGEGLRWRPERQGGLALDDALRDLRLVPTLQLGISYSF